MSWDDPESTIARLTNLANTTRVAKRSDPILPNGPLFYQFPSQEYHYAAVTGFLNAFELALEGLKVVWKGACSDTGDMPPAYTRYFNTGEDIRQTIEAVLKAILGPDGIGPLLMKDPQYPLEVWYHHNDGPNGYLDNRRCDTESDIGSIFWNFDDPQHGHYGPVLSWMVGTFNGKMKRLTMVRRISAP